MKKIILALALVLGTAGSVFAGDPPKDTPSKDEDHHGSLHYSCRLNSEMKGVKLGFVFGIQVMGGRGEIHCVDMRHGQMREVRVPVKVKVVGAGPSFDFTIVRGVKMTSGGVGYVHDPMDLTGSFTVAASAGATLIKRGYNVQSAISVKKHGHGLAYELGFSGERAYGLGARLHGMMMFVKPLKNEKGESDDE